MRRRLLVSLITILIVAIPLVIMWWFVPKARVYHVSNRSTVLQGRV